nr:MAG TPA: hypothetical protein [Caudoviricetes sp.]
MFVCLLYLYYIINFSFCQIFISIRFSRFSFPFSTLYKYYTIDFLFCQIFGRFNFESQFHLMI